MPDKFKDTINLPIAIPAWGLLSILIGGFFTAGVTFQKLDQVIETSKKIDVIQERQINGLAILSNNTLRISNLEARMTEVEKRR